jgi:hypothetical protein
MRPELKQRIQIVLLIAIGLAAMRAGWIFYQRHEENKRTQGQKQQGAAPPLNPDYYISPKKLHAYDLKSARELTKQPVWVKEGYRYTYYPYQSSTHRANFIHEAGLLLPLQRLEITDVALSPSPRTPGQKQVVAVFNDRGKSYALPIGIESGGDYKIYADEMLFIQDPKELYKHWPADVWNSIERHEIKPGMNELQADFAIGMGVPERSEDANVKTVKYPNGGSPLTVTYRDGEVVDVKPSSPA